MEMWLCERIELLLVMKIHRNRLIMSKQELGKWVPELVCSGGIKHVRVVRVY